MRCPDGTAVLVLIIEDDDVPPFQSRRWRIGDSPRGRKPDRLHHFANLRDLLRVSPPQAVHVEDVHGHLEKRRDERRHIRGDRTGQALILVFQHLLGQDLGESQNPFLPKIGQLLVEGMACTDAISTPS